MNASETPYCEALNRHPPEVGGIALYRALRWLKTPYAFLDQYAAKLGTTFSMTLPGIGRVLVTGDAQLIAESTRNKALVGGRGTRALRPILGERSLIVLEGQSHRNHRRSIASSLSADAAGQLDDLTLNVCREEIARQRPGEFFSVQAVTRAISLRLIIRVLFGEMSGENERQLIALVESLLSSFKQPAVLFIKVLHLDFGRYSPWGRFVRRKARLRTFIMEQIVERRNSTGSNASLIDQLIEQQDRGDFRDSDDAIFEELMSLLLFGHDTSAATLAWVFHHVHRDPVSLEKLRNDALKEDMPTEFFSACIKESQRLCPVVVHVTRVATRSTRIGDFELREGDTVLPCMYLAQRDPQHFPNPTSFSPQRFLDAKRMPAGSNFPFGLGARKCIGATFAKRQLALILYAFMRHTRLEAADTLVRPVREMLLIVPSGGAVMRMTERSL